MGVRASFRLASLRVGPVYVAFASSLTEGGGGVGRGSIIFSAQSRAFRPDVRAFVSFVCFSREGRTRER